jgi:protein TonB
MWTPQNHLNLVKAVHDFDEHLTVSTSGINGEMTLEIRAPGTGGTFIARPDGVLAGIIGGLPTAAPAPPRPPAMSEPNSITATPKGVRLDAGVAAANLISQTKPEYPPLAKAARVQGTVKFDALIGKDGTVQNLHLISGPPLLVQAAMQAVQQWIYKPTLLNGQPLDVSTTIDVNFTLAQE